MKTIDILVLLAGTTLVSEDAALAAAGLLAAAGDAPYVAAVLGCAAGIVAGDMALWAIGRAGGGKVGSLPFVSRLAARVDHAAVARRVDRQLGVAVLASRGLPGTRLPLYLAAGMLGVNPWRLAGWTVVSVAVWVPPVVALVAALGAELSGSLRVWVTAFPLATAAVVAALTFVVRRALGSRVEVQRLAARIERWRRWEFWPAWLLYAPVAVWVAGLAVRHRGLAVVAAANPGIAHGGLAGESKFEIQRALPAEWAIPAVCLPPGEPRGRALALREAMTSRGWRFPIALKPDVGQRGDGVRRVMDAGQAAEYFAIATGPVLAQPWSDAPFEAGLYYVRMPGDARGRVLSITDKRFAEVEGDGTSTLEQLVWQHPRYRLQAATFLARLGQARARTPARGERVRLGFVGNHKQGTLFLNGQHLWSEALERRVDAIARRVPGFFIGRFDVRYRDVERFRAGEDLEIVELNGVSAEPTHIYDPDGTLVEACRALCRHWTSVFAIGAANRRDGVTSSSTGRLVWTACAHLAARPALPVAD